LHAIAILFGVVAIAAGVLEIGVTMLAQGWWKLLYGVLAVVFIAAGIVSFIHPGDTFLALAAVISFFLACSAPSSASLPRGRVIRLSHDRRTHLITSAYQFCEARGSFPPRAFCLGR
jgi:hypothetical protein